MRRNGCQARANLAAHYDRLKREPTEETELRRDFNKDTMNIIPREKSELDTIMRPVRHKKLYNEDPICARNGKITSCKELLVLGRIVFCFCRFLDMLLNKMLYTSECLLLLVSREPYAMIVTLFVVPGVSCCRKQGPGVLVLSSGR